MVFVIVIALLMCECLGGQEQDISWILSSAEGDWRLNDYMGYLDRILKEEHHKLGNLRLSIPQSLADDGFALSDGRVVRFSEPNVPHGFYDRAVFHEKDGEVFGVVQVYAPSLVISYQFIGPCGPGRCSGQLEVVVTHEPVQVSVDVAEARGATCHVAADNSPFYFYNRNLNVNAAYLPNGGREAHLGQEIVNRISSTWLPDLYRIAFEIKLEDLAKRIKQDIIKHNQIPLVGRVCRLS